MAAKASRDFLVHSVTVDPVEVLAKVNGVEMTVTVPALVVELITEDRSMSQTLRFTAADLPENNVFFEGKMVRASYTPIADPA